MWFIFLFHFSQVDRIMAFSRLRQSGAFLTTSEGLILQLVRDAAHPSFREVINYVAFLEDLTPNFLVTAKLCYSLLKLQA